MEKTQLALWPEAAEDSRFLSDQLLTYIGNKRSLLDPIAAVLERVRLQSGGKPLRMLDAFSGSGVVSRLMKSYASCVVANDIEDYATAVSRCFLSNSSTVKWEHLTTTVAELNGIVDQVQMPRGFIEHLYSPHDEENITAGDRVFYTRTNARRIDNYRRLLMNLDITTQSLLLGPLLSAVSVHANTAGVFKGFYKDRATGVGKFGGTARNALLRILGQIALNVPILSRFECDYEVYQEDCAQLVSRIGEFDLAYFDPPYNEHPYGSNYFMLNLVLNYAEPSTLSKVSGIPTNWKRSDFNSPRRALVAFSNALRLVDTRYILVSYNSEGFIKPDDMRRLLESRGEVEVMPLSYNTYRGSRNLRARSIHVTEYLFLVKTR